MNTGLVSLLMCICASAGSAVNLMAEAHRPLTREEKLKQAYENIKSGTIHGRVIDQSGKPLANATVIVSWYTLGWVLGGRSRYEEAELLADTEGCFEYQYGKVSKLHLKALKAGYDGVGTDKSINVQQVKTSRDEPVVLNMRKMEEPVFLIVQPLRGTGVNHLFSTEQKQAAITEIDLLGYDRQNPISPENRYVDCSIETSFVQSNNCWKVVFRANTLHGGGLMCSDDLRYAAPENGYKQEASVLLNAGSKKELIKYLYVQSRDSKIFSRIKFELDTRENGDKLRIYYKAWINPTGGRILEEEPQLDSFTYDELVKEAKDAILSKRHMPQPDIPLRLKQNKERREAEQEARKKRIQGG